MEFRILDKNFIDKVLLDRYESMLWVDRYDEPGEFELYTPPTDLLLENCQIGNYIYSKTSDHLMIIEHVELTTNYEEGNKIIIKGRSVECILARRMLWYKTKFIGNLEDDIRQILDFSMINPPTQYEDAVTHEIVQKPEWADRKIDNFRFSYSTDTRINHAVANSEYEIGTDLLTVVVDLCKKARLGFKITLNDSNEFVFKLYSGDNRSYSQFMNPWIVFSKRFENLITNEFKSDVVDYHNVVRTLAQPTDADVFDFISYETQRMNILDLTTTGSEDIQINNDYKPFTFNVNGGKLTINNTYAFTSLVTVLEGNITKVTVELLGMSTFSDHPVPSGNIYASKDVDIVNGRITTKLKVVKPSVEADDCYYLVVYAGVKNQTTDMAIELSRPIFSATDENFKAVGLDRVEIFNDGSDVEITEEMQETWDDQDGGKAQYEALLQESAYKVLDNNIAKTEVDGTVNDMVPYTYGVDYNIGDIVQVENEFGILGTMRVAEFVTSHTTSGVEMYPTFKSTSEGEY